MASDNMNLSDDLNTKVDSAIQDVVDDKTDDQGQTDSGAPEGGDDKKTDDSDNKDDNLRVTETELQFLRAIQDPNVAPTIIKTMAEQLGLKVVEPDKEPQQKKGDEPDGSLKALLEKSLGPEFEFLAPRIAEPIERAIKGIEQRVRDELEREKSSLVQQTYRRAEREFFDAVPEARKLKRVMYDIAKTYPMPDGQDPLDYLQDLYSLAIGRSKRRRSLVSLTKERDQRAASNFEGRDVSGGFSPRVTKRPQGKVSIRDAVKAAAEGIKWE